MDSGIRILLVEDNPADARLLREILRDVRSFEHGLTHVERLADACASVAGDGADVVLLDLSLPDAHGMETVSRMLAAAPEAAIIVLTGLDDEDTAVRAVQAGAQDYLSKGQVEPALLGRSIRYAIERKRLERERAQLLQREQEARAAAEAAVRGRDEVLRIVSHDLGNSLSAILVTTTVLLRTLADEVDAKTLARIDDIRAIADQMQRLRQDLLDVAMIEAGRLSVQHAPVVPQRLVEAAVERYTAMAAEKGVTLVSRASGATAPIRADETRLAQVLANLITNAIKFTQGGGRIVASAESSRDEACFRVEDSGSGIPSEHMSHLFDRFWTTKAGNPHGAGLGLAIARGIVEAHGGRIRAESRPGQGSTFTFTIPTV